MNPETDDEMYENILHLCETDPDTGLAFINQITTDNPSLMTFPFLLLCKIRAYQIKGVSPLKDQPGICATSEPEELLLYLNDENLNAMESALSELHKANEIDPSMFNDLGSEWDEQILALSSILNRCRPGRVQQLCGKTKIQFFSLNQTRVIPNGISPESLKVYTQISFKFPQIVKSLIIIETGTDERKRNFLHLWVFDKLFEKFRQDETFGDAKLGSLYLFDDGTFSYALDGKD